MTSLGGEWTRYFCQTKKSQIKLLQDQQMEVLIKQLDVNHYAQWDLYVDKSENSTFFHRARWHSVLPRAFGHKPHFFYAERGGEIVGILPTAHVKSMLFGNSLASLPFCVYGGVVADDAEVANKLLVQASELGTQLNVDAVEIRSLEPIDQSWPDKDLYVTFRRTMDPDHEANLKAIPGKQRAMVRKGAAEGLASEFDDGVDRVYHVYSESLRNLGTPVFSKKYLRILREEFGSDCDVLMITQGDRDVAGVLNFYFKDQVLPYYGGSITEARNIRGVNHFMYAELMRHSVDRGYRIFDFGRSKKGTGAFEFKRNFGFEPEQLHYQYFLVKSQQVPELNPNNPKYQKMIEIWKKLPLSVANSIGPFVAKYLG